MSEKKKDRTLDERRFYPRSPWWTHKFKTRPDEKQCTCGECMMAAQEMNRERVYYPSWVMNEAGFIPPWFSGDEQWRDER